MTKASATAVDWTDPLDLRSCRLTDEERMISQVARSYARALILGRAITGLSAF